MKHFHSARLALIDLVYDIAMKAIARLEQARDRALRSWRGCEI